MLFQNRAEAGRQLAERLRSLAGPDVVVVGLPRGGVPVAYEVATALGAPLDVIVVRKLGVPIQPELAMGAVGEGGVRILNDRVLRTAGVGVEDLDKVEQRERSEVTRRAQRLRGERPAVPLAGRVAVVVDDGIATGSTMSVACEVARAKGARKVIAAAPVGSPGVAARLGPAADETVCLYEPTDFFSVGQAYVEFPQTTDLEVTELLRRAGAPPPVGREVVVPSGPERLQGALSVPDGATALVVFAHGSGSSRHSPRNQRVARVLNGAGLGTLLFDLLTADEEGDRAKVFDIELLADRLRDATAWLAGRLGGGYRIGCFGASTGAAAALRAAAAPDSGIDAIVSRGGRPDLAGRSLAQVRAPTLLIVGARDEQVLELNRSARARLRCESRLAIVPGATHLFAEPGALDAVAELARGWFAEHLAR